MGLRKERYSAVEKARKEGQPRRNDMEGKKEGEMAKKGL